MRAVSLFENGILQKEAIVSLFKHELEHLQKQAETLYAFAQQTSIELRQRRESQEQRGTEPTEVNRTLEEDNDQFVAQLIAEHETQVLALRRERDAAIERVRELSRGLSRIGGLSSPNLRRTSSSNLPAASTSDSDVALLRARVDELLFERERSMKLLRQLAEQRDQAESRLHVVLSSAPPGPERSDEPPVNTPAPAISSDQDDAVDWDLSSPAPHPLSLTQEEEAESEPSSVEPPSVSETTLPLLRRKTTLGGDGAGTYSISARELPSEEVVVLRSRPSNPQAKP